MVYRHFTQPLLKHAPASSVLNVGVSTIFIHYNSVILVQRNTLLCIDTQPQSSGNTGAELALTQVILMPGLFSKWRCFSSELKL